MVTITVGLGYVKTVQGILKCSECLMCLIGLLLVVCTGYSSDLLNAYIAGVVIGLVVSLVLLLLHITKIASSIAGFIAYQLYLLLLVFIYLIIVSAILLSKNYSDNALNAAGGFGIIACILYLVDALDWFRNDPALLCCFRR